MGIKVGVNGVARDSGALSCGVGGVMREMQEGYCGVAGVTRQFFKKKLPPPTAFDTELVVNGENKYGPFKLQTPMHFSAGRTFDGSGTVGMPMTTNSDYSTPSIHVPAEFAAVFTSGTVYVGNESYPNSISSSSEGSQTLFVNVGANLLVGKTISIYLSHNP